MIRVGVIAVGYRRPGLEGSRDVCAQVIADLLPRIGAGIKQYRLVRGDRGDISLAVARMTDGGEIDLVITSGGLGEDCENSAPEATMDVMDSESTELTEIIRAKGLSRAMAGLRKNTLIINLPDDPKLTMECLRDILPAVALSMKDREMGNQEIR